MSELKATTPNNHKNSSSVGSDEHPSMLIVLDSKTSTKSSNDKTAEKPKKPLNQSMRRKPRSKTGTKEVKQSMREKPNASMRRKRTTKITTKEGKASTREKRSAREGRKSVNEKKSSVREKKKSENDAKKSGEDNKKSGEETKKSVKETMKSVKESKRSEMTSVMKSEMKGPESKRRGKRVALLESVQAFAKHVEEKTWDELAEEFNAGLRKDSKGTNEATRVKLTTNVPPESDFYDANRVEFEGIDSKFIAASMPAKDATSQESFWRMVYDSAVTNIFFLEKVEDFEKKHTPFYVMKANETKDFGKMCVMNKKQITINEEPKAMDHQYVFEVLPDGCSNSVVTRFIQPRTWPATATDRLREVLTLARLIKNETSPQTLVVCENGKGKSGMFILLLAAINKLLANQQFTLSSLLEKLRSDRWGAVETVEQYLLTYSVLLAFLVSKWPSTYRELVNKKKKDLKEWLKKKEDK